MSRELLKQWVNEMSCIDTPLVYRRDPIDHPDVVTVYADMIELPYTGEVLSRGESFKYNVEFPTVSESVPTWDYTNPVIQKSIRKRLVKWKPTTVDSGQFTFKPQFEWS